MAEDPIKRKARLKALRKKHGLGEFKSKSPKKKRTTSGKSAKPVSVRSSKNSLHSHSH